MSWWEDEIASRDGYGIRPADEGEPPYPDNDGAAAGTA